MTNAKVALQYLDNQWPVAPIFHTDNGGFELAGTVFRDRAGLIELWREHPQAGIALYCQGQFASLELPAYLGLRLFQRLGERCPTAVIPAGANRWQFIVRPDSSLLDPELVGEHGRLYHECAFRPVAPHRRPAGLARLWQRGSWLVHPRATMWEPGDGHTVAVNLRQIAGESLPSRGSARLPAPPRLAA